MNYERIYAEFIRDRLTKQPKKPEYFEAHHIRPRSLGGGNEPRNLVRLTPEDHLFAHLLLANIHGGPMWAALFLMAAPRSNGKIRSSRKLRAAFGLARRKWAEYASTLDGLKGADNGNYNDTVYRWAHLDSGDKREATLHSMWIEFGGNRGMWTSAATPGSGKHSALGWALDDGQERSRSSKGKVFTFVNADGVTFHGTQIGFAKVAKCSMATASRIVKKGDVSKGGWRLDGTPERDWHEIKPNAVASRASRGKIFLARKDGVEIQGRMIDIAISLGVKTQRFCAAMYQIRSGVCKTYKGWEIVEMKSSVESKEILARGDAEQVCA